MTNFTFHNSHVTLLSKSLESYFALVNVPCASGQIESQLCYRQGKCLSANRSARGVRFVTLLAQHASPYEFRGVSPVIIAHDCGGEGEVWIGGLHMKDMQTNEEENT